MNLKLFKYISPAHYMNKTTKNLLDIFFRYLILVLLGLINIWIFYVIFTPLTVYPVYHLLNLLFESILKGNLIYMGEKIIEIVPACVAGAAYYLLLILNLATPNIKLKKRVKMITWSFVILLILNVLRIFFLSLLYIGDFALFDIVHKIFWYFISTLFVIAIWFKQVKIFKIKDIPIYSDIKFLYKKSTLRPK